MSDTDSEVEVRDRRAARWTGQRAKRRSEFVEAAIVAIAAHGPTVSTEQIAAQAGVARTQLYRHFQDADDLHRAVALRAADLVIEEMAPLLTEPGGAPAQMVERAVRTQVKWLAEHVNLYRYVTQRATSGPGGHHDVVADIKTTLGDHVSALLDGYLAAFEIRAPIADTVAFGLVGFVESATDRWLRDPGTLTLDQLADYLSAWIWGTLDHIFRDEGVVVDPDEPIAPPADLAKPDV